MAKSVNKELPQQEVPMFGFMNLIKQSGELPSKVAGRTGDPLTIAKTAILKSLDDQQRYLTMMENNQPLPKTAKGGKTVSTWFTKGPDGSYWTSIRYGQLPITINGMTGFQIGHGAELTAFYDAVRTSIKAGEMDKVIGDLQKGRSEKLTASHAARKANGAGATV